MTNFLLGGILAFAVAAAIECFLLLGRVQLLFNHIELMLRAAYALLGQFPSKSAARTIAAIDEKPRPWFQTLRRLAELGEHLARVASADDVAEDLVDEVEPEEDVEDVDVELDRWADDGGLIPPAPVKAAFTADRLPGDIAHTEVESTVDEDQTPTETFPPVPATEPVERIEIAGGLRLPPEGQTPVEHAPTPELVDEVDLLLVRFGLRTAEGHRP